MRNSVTLGNLKKGDYSFEEAIKTLRTNIQFCGRNIKVIMLGSAVPNEGKSSMSFSLAASLAQIGKKVLFIDADIRKSVMVSRYQLDKEVNGLSQYLSGQKGKEEIIYETNLKNLSVVFSGPYSPNPAELLEEPIFSLLIQSARAEYDYIIIDTPPLLNLIDGAIIANHCDGAVIVIASGGVSYRIEQKIKKQLEKSKCRILGVILNKVSTGSSRYYGEYKKYGKYKNDLQEIKQ
ncbi:CpsD/CapB family tyrosine-protein kinase [Clostridium sp. Marseille-P2415]|uniref:CpsD/CapB family tyrosine-protein kinase n=1 Tax=Clostridium sp. Marseille-P2415 TaxID=1805471 RepID=UPI00098846D0|nr:CpsD/CapB family tyrosine-protein kinase [Clostridium sp. Marseille-P2415]